MKRRQPPNPRERGRARSQLALLLGLAAGGMTLGAVGAATDPDPALQSELTALLERTGWRGATWGILAVSLEAGDTLFALNADMPLVPASNMKLLTAAAALHHLGPDFRYRTFLLARGPVIDGVLEGDLILYGTGDPALSWRFSESRTALLEAMADSVVAKLGIRSVRGEVIGDGTFFGGPGIHPDWDKADLDDWYAAPASALSFNENVVTLRVVGGKDAGQPPTVHTIPTAAQVPIRNRSVTVAGRSRRMHAGRVDGTGPIVVQGEIGTRGPDRWRLVSVAEPEAFAAGALRRALQERGVTVSGGSRGLTDPGASYVSGQREWTLAQDSTQVRIVSEHRSPPLTELVNVMNKTSHNLYAELLLKTLGRTVDGDGSFEGGGRVMERFLVDVVGANPDEVAVVDGSGLARSNRISADVFVRTLRFIRTSPFREELLGSLPQSGAEELGRMTRGAAAENLRAKTGTLTGVSALSGELRTLEGETVFFSILQNDVPSRRAAKRVEDALSERIASLRRAREGGAVQLRPGGG